MTRMASVHCKIVLLTLLAGLLAFPLIASAGDEDGDPNGTRLKALLEEPAIAEKLKKSPVSSDGDFDVLCGLEISNAIGDIIWEYRRRHDDCPSRDKWTSVTYCVTHSNTCKHFTWNPHCLYDSDRCP